MVAWAYCPDEGISVIAKLKEAVLACEKDLASYFYNNDDELQLVLQRIDYYRHSLISGGFNVAFNHLETRLKAVFLWACFEATQEVNHEKSRSLWQYRWREIHP